MKLSYESLNVIGAVWVSMLLGSALMIVSAVAGWSTARDRALPPVRLIGWWVCRVVLPLVRSRSWWRRAGAIFLNNGSILAVLVMLGQWPWAPLLGVAGLGVSLGIALRVLSDLPGELALPRAQSNGHATRRIRAGVALNLLEPPAIMLAIGLSLGQQRDASLSLDQVWATFAFWIVPATLLAAGGEALWLGAYRRADNKVAPPCPENEDAHTNP